MTYDDIVARGRMALRILADPATMSFFEELRGDLVQSLVTTHPEQSAERERLYYRHTGLGEVLDMMRTYAARAEELLDQDNA